MKRLLLTLPVAFLFAACGDSATGPVDDAAIDLTSLSLPTYQAAVTESGIWVQNPDSRHSYALTDNMPYLEAEAWAVAQGGHLVTLNSWEEELWLKQTFGENEHFFIGFNDIEEEGNWVWTSGAQVTYTNWAPGEPNDYMGEDAAVMNWCEEGGNENPECLGDTWNDLGTGGGRAIAEVGKGPEGGAQKVDICHVDGRGRYRPISVAHAAVPAHMAHGDNPLVGSWSGLWYWWGGDPLLWEIEFRDDCAGFVEGAFLGEAYYKPLGLPTFTWTFHASTTDGYEVFETQRNGEDVLLTLTYDVETEELTATVPPEWGAQWGVATRAR